MSGRVLNFSEFYSKYSKDSSDAKKTIDTFTQSSANFQQGFDEETYDQAEIGPNRPIDSGSEATPPSPEESGAPKFTSKTDAELNAPEETEKEEKEEESTEKEEAKEKTPEPEAGANPKKEIKESIKFNSLYEFERFVTESYHEEHDPFEEGEEFPVEHTPFDEDESGIEEICKHCGHSIEYTTAGAMCHCN